MGQTGNRALELLLGVALEVKEPEADVADVEVLLKFPDTESLLTDEVELSDTELKLDASDELKLAANDELMLDIDDGETEADEMDDTDEAEVDDTDEAEVDDTDEAEVDDTDEAEANDSDEAEIDDTETDVGRPSEIEDIERLSEREGIEILGREREEPDEAERLDEVSANTVHGRAATATAAKMAMLLLMLDITKD